MKLLMTTIYHNPRCSKSRATMKLVEEAGVTPNIVLYLEQPPDSDTLKSIIEMLGCPVSHIIRKGEAIYRELGLADRTPDDGELLQILVSHPQLLERPIVVNNGKAVIGRPPENVLTIL